MKITKNNALNFRILRKYWKIVRESEVVEIELLQAIYLQRQLAWLKE